MSLCLSVLLTLWHGYVVVVPGPCTRQQPPKPPVVWVEPEIARRVG